jgi:C-terminal processing protease CtpA/Prc
MKRIIPFSLLLIVFTGCIEAPPESTDWNINIDYFAETLEKHHKNLFFNLSKEDFYGQIGDLKLKTGNLYVIIGKFTFSSALLNAIDLKQKTNAILIGSPTGGKPNHYGEVKSFQLNKLDLKVWYSSNFFKNVDGDPPSLEPDIFIPITSDDMRALTDPCLEYVIGQ